MKPQQDIQIIKSSTIIGIEDKINLILDKFQLMDKDQKTELPIPLTDENCQKYFNFDVVTLKRRLRKGKGSLRIYGKSKTQYVFPDDIATYVRSLG